MNERTILHCDCNSFFASVEIAQNPRLKDMPVAVAGDSETRHGIILAKNEIAKKFGIVTAEPVMRAKNKCPELVTVPPNHELYCEYSERVNDIYLEYTDLAEKFGIDETWLDVTGCKGLFGSGIEIAETLRRRVKNEIGITVSIGVSFNKIFAKLGSDYKKPDAITVITKENFKKIVYPLPVEALLFVGGKTVETLKKMYIKTIGDLAETNVKLLTEKFGKNGEMLSIYAKGLDNEPVKSAFFKDSVKSVSKGRTLPYDIISREEIRREILILSDYVAENLRRKNMKCRGVQLHIKDSKFCVKSRQKTLSIPTLVSSDIAEYALELYDELGIFGVPVRAVTVTATNLENVDSSRQLSLIEETERKDKEKLWYTVDRLRSLYGKEIIMRPGEMKK